MLQNVNNDINFRGKIRRFVENIDENFFWPYCWHMVLTPLRFKTKIMGSIILDEN